MSLPTISGSHMLRHMVEEGWWKNHRKISGDLRKVKTGMALYKNHLILSFYRV